MIKKAFRHLRAKIFAGILVLLPIGITFFVLKLVFNTLDSILGPLIPRIPVFLFERMYNLPGLGFIAFFVLVYLIGVVTTNVLGRHLVQWADRLFINIPIVKNIYLSSKQLADAFSPTRKGSFRQAVFVEFPQPGNYVLGFVTNELKDLENGTKVTVFIPTGFVPPAGHLLFVPKEKVLPSQFTIEEAIKTIMSVGMVTPSTVSIHVSGAPSSPEKEPFANFKEIKYVNPKTEGGL